MPSGRTNNHAESGRGLGHVTPTIFGIRSNISLKLLELETSNLIHGFVWAMPSRRINNFPESSRGLGQVTLTIFGSTVGYPSDSLASCSCHNLYLSDSCSRTTTTDTAYDRGYISSGSDMIIGDILVSCNFIDFLPVDGSVMKQN